MNGAPAVRHARLSALLEGLGGELRDLQVTGLSTDSRQLKSGDLFIALRGQAHDGRDYLSQAARAGAVAALVEEPPLSAAPLPVLCVPGLREALGSIASRFYGNPSQRMYIAAVTGTNGKTTVSQLFAQLVRQAGYDCGVIGTLGASLDSLTGSATHTTPDPITLQARLADWVEQAVPFTAMEASSHALHQGRLNAVEIEAAVFTNLTRDHLDYHGDMATYGEAKARLFTMPALRDALLNADDPFSDTLEQRIASQVRVLRYGMNAARLDVRISQLSTSAGGLRLRFDSPWGAASLRCPLLGDFNAMNLTAALAAALQAGLPFDRLVPAVERLQPVAGRMEPLRIGRGPLVVIDYAHTPDALAQVLQSLRGQCRGRLIAVFGCGGDRDRGKRALMAAAVSGAADSAVLTSDNPRGEDPRAIIADIEAAMHIDYRVEEDRATAIRGAIAGAGREDCVLVAGKGHEDYQIVGERRLPFSDSEVARQVLEERVA